MQKRILYITNGITGSGGLERVVSIKASYFADEYDYDVHIITINEQNKTKFYSLSDSVMIHNIEVRGNLISFYKTYIYKIKSILKKINPDIILVADDGLKGVLFPLIFKPKCKIVYERHTTKAIHGNGLKGKLIGSLMNFGSTRFDHFVVLTNSNKKDWPKAQNIEVIPNPLPFHCELVSPITKRNKIISVGSLSYFKGHDVLINAWSLIANKYPHISLHIYGEKKDNYDNILNLIQKYDLNKSVFIHKPTKNIKGKYLESAVCVLPSRVEGFGMVLIEAMECGTPCIATKCEGPIDIITDDKNGYLINIDDSDELAKKLEKILSNKQLTELISINSRNSAKQYHIDSIMDRWNKLII